MSSEAKEPLTDVVQKLAPDINEVKPDVDIAPGQILFSDVGGKYHAVHVPGIECCGFQELEESNSLQALC
jgi:hypothetical protein